MTSLSPQSDTPVPGEERRKYLTRSQILEMLFEDETEEANEVLKQAECDIRDYGKKVHGFEIEFDETTDKLNKANESFEEKDKMHKEVEADIAALSRR